MHSALSFLKHYAILLFLLICATVLINTIIDPYEIFFTHCIPIEQKPAALTHERMHKAHQLKKIQPQTLILGTSRAGVGFDPTLDYFHFQPAYNLALDGACFYEMLRYFEHALAYHPVKEVLLCLDLLSFNAYLKHNTDFHEGRLATPQHRFTIEKEWLNSLFSYDALKDSFQTVFHTFDVTLPSLHTLGNTNEKALFQYKKIRGGSRNTTIISEKSYLNETYRQFSLFNSNTGYSHFEAYRSFLQLCHEKGISVILLIPPIHARHQMLIAIKNLWETYENWKRLLVHYNEEIARTYHSTAFPLWDFSNLNDYTMEAFPKLNQPSYAMQWYWESSHFNRQLGEHLLKEIYLSNNVHYTEKTHSTPFGMRLNQQNIETYLTQLRLALNEYKKQHTHVYNELIALLEE